MSLDHRPDCQLLTVPVYGLCTCDFDERMKAAIEEKHRQRLEQEQQDNADGMLVCVIASLGC